MSQTVTYHCPNCAAGLTFSPEKRKFCCEFCLSEFTEQELADTASAKEAEEQAFAAQEDLAQNERPDEEFCAQMGRYSCAACGAEVIADDATAATECPYCHNPVILAGKLSGQMRPHKVIPFKFDKKEAEEKFLAFAKKKWFLPRDFATGERAEKIVGIYYPFWVTDADVGANMTARATRVRTWRQGDYRYTETSRFRILREGEIHFEDIVTPALKEEDREMLNGILPYPSSSLEPFSMPYLSGFIAKKRDIEREEVRAAVHARMQDYAARLLRETISGYTTVVPNAPRLLLRTIHWDYTLMPVWLLTYPTPKKRYTYAMNGYTGKIYGELPVSPWKLALVGGIVGLLVGAAAALLRFFL